MDKVVKVLRYDNTKVESTIEDFKNLRGLFIKVISGDHVVTPIYESGLLGNVIDPSPDRFCNFLDGVYFVPAICLDDYNELTSADQIGSIDQVTKL